MPQGRAVSWGDIARGLLGCLLIGSLGSRALPAEPAAPALGAKRFVHGLWFDGSGFKQQTFYAAAGVLTRNRPRGVLDTIDLQNGYVVPAFGEAHNHFPDSRKNLAWANAGFLKAGVFYVLNPNDIAELSNPIRQDLGTPSTVDVIFAHAGFTSPGGHPTDTYERLVDLKIYSYAKSDLEGRAFYTIDSQADIDQKWPQFLATKPDFVKLYLLHSEMYQHPNSKYEQARKQGRAGLRPEYLEELIRRAHSAGLRAGAHVESAADFHAAVANGIDFVMHLPGVHWLPGDTAREYLISDADVRLARKHDVTVVTTISLTDSEPQDERARVRNVQAANLRHLKDAGVNIVIGTDGRPDKISDEIADLRATGVFTAVELLRMLSEATPRAIFPTRRLGRLDEGYEADFLVLHADPLKTQSALEDIAMRIKHGVVQASIDTTRKP